ncbi:MULTISPECIES: glycoside hydrolase family 26 protein [Nocardiopsis]|uniref:Glycosyl hydrolase family 26 n=1 Tax=Nocardiopsis sinuspersici TaxID=501010 RepID=A0A1V3C3Y5_9ACTN|nr:MULTISPECIES: glycosyl hydrolase [Nocardiopsis]OOC55497.1 glycosyl hydrolase family 26 [Nocardiopsis sinuspersici]
MGKGPVRAVATTGAMVLALTLAGVGDAPAAPLSPRQDPPNGSDSDGYGPDSGPLPDGYGSDSGPLPDGYGPADGHGSDEDCTVSEILEPSCGVWWGASPYQRRVEPLEEAVDRRMDIVYTWHGIDQAHIPGEREKKLIAEERFVHTNIEARRFTRSGHPPVSYRSIIDGEFDRSLRSQAGTIAELGVPYFVTFDHEADANKRYNRRGTPEEFVQAWRHIVDLYREEGADNAIWVWNVTGWKGNFERLPKLWPGNDYVDWLSWEAYNMTGCDIHPHWTEVYSFEEALRPAYEWIQTEGPEHGIDPDKPVMIGEMGTTHIGARETREWYSEIPDVLRRYERVRAVKVWDNRVSPGCDFRIGANRHARKGFEEAGHDPYVKLPEWVRRLVEYAERRG